MLALRWHGRRDVRLEEVPPPDPPGPGEALISVGWCGICGTDIAEFRSGPKLIHTSPHPLSQQAPPITLGHELAGHLVATGSDVDLQPGSRVTVDACLRCRRCEACLRGQYHRCRHGGAVGLHADGGFAPYVKVPAYTLVPVPESVPDRWAALAEPLAVALHALGRANLKAGERVLVLGFGPIGAGSALLARVLGAQVWVVESSPPRRAQATDTGFATVPAGAELPRRARSLLGHGGADVVVESTGAPGLLSDAIDCACRGGRIAALGLGASSSEIVPSSLVLFERALIGSLGYCHDLPRILTMMATGQLDPGALISDTVPLTAAGEALRQLSTEPGGHIKVLVQSN